MFWKETFIAERRNEWLKAVGKVQYYSNGVWRDATITEMSIDGSILKITYCITDNGKDTHITGIRILDKNGKVAGQESESITKKSSQWFYGKWEFPIYETE